MEIQQPCRRNDDRYGCNDKMMAFELHRYANRYTT
jgi:hypothetical protein